MKTKKLLTLAVLGMLFLFNSCSSDETSPTKEFSSEIKTYDLEGANIYLTQSWDFENRENRTYFITDGIYTNGGSNLGWGFDDYEGATYYIGIEVASNVGETLQKGEYPLYSSWPDAADNENIGSIYVESDPGDFFIIHDKGDNPDGEPIKISGGFDDGETITMSFDGTLRVNYRVGDTRFTNQNKSVKFYFSGKVQDERLL